MDKKEFVDEAVALMGKMGELLIDKNPGISLLVTAELLIRMADFMGIDREEYLEKLRIHWIAIEQEEDKETAYQ